MKSLVLNKAGGNMCTNRLLVWGSCGGMNIERWADSVNLERLRMLTHALAQDGSVVRTCMLDAMRRLAAGTTNTEPAMETLMGSNAPPATGGEVTWMRRLWEWMSKRGIKLFEPALRQESDSREGSNFHTLMSHQGYSTDEKKQMCLVLSDRRLCSTSEVVRIDGCTLRPSVLNDPPLLEVLEKLTQLDSGRTIGHAHRSQPLLDPGRAGSWVAYQGEDDILIGRVLEVTAGTARIARYTATHERAVRRECRSAQPYMVLRDEEVEVEIPAAETVDISVATSNRKNDTGHLWSHPDAIAEALRRSEQEDPGPQPNTHTTHEVTLVGKGVGSSALQANLPHAKPLQANGEQALARLAASGQVISVYTDASYKAGREIGAYGWVVGVRGGNTKTGHFIPLVCGGGWEQGSNNIARKLSSTRLEKLAILSACTFLKGAGITRANIHADNQSANKWFNDRRHLHGNWYDWWTKPHNDLDAALQTRTQGMEDFKVYWVRGHVENRKKDPKNWEIHETGNFLADAIAEAAYTDSLSEPRPLQTHRLHRAQRTRITYQNSEVTDSITSALRTFISEHYTRSYMLGRKDIWGTNLDSLEMRKLTCHRRHQQLRQRVFTTKFMFGLLATEAEMHKRDPDRCGKCSLCSLDERQTNWHIFARCTSDTATSARKEWSRRIQGAITQYMKPEWRQDDDQDNKGGKKPTPDPSILHYSVGISLQALCDLAEDDTVREEWAAGTSPLSAQDDATADTGATVAAAELRELGANAQAFERDARANVARWAQTGDVAAVAATAEAKTRRRPGHWKAAAEKFGKGFKGFFLACADFGASSSRGRAEWLHERLRRRAAAAAAARAHATAAAWAAAATASVAAHTAALAAGTAQQVRQQKIREVSSVGARAWWKGVWHTQMHDLLTSGGLSPRRANKALHAMSAEHRKGWVGLYHGVLKEQHDAEHQARQQVRDAREDKIDIQVRLLHRQLGDEGSCGGMSADERVRTWGLARKTAWVERLHSIEQRRTQAIDRAKATRALHAMRAMPQPTPSQHQPKLITTLLSAQQAAHTARHRERALRRRRARVVDDGDDEDDGAREREKQRQVRAAAASAEEVARTAAAELAQCEKDQARLTAERERRVRARQIAGQGRREARDRRERQRRATTSQRGNKDAAEKESITKQTTTIKRLTQAANKRAKVKTQNDRARVQAARQRRIEIHNMLEKLRKEEGGGFKEFFLTCARLGVEQKAAARAMARGTGRDGKRLSGAGEKAAQPSGDGEG